MNEIVHQVHHMLGTCGEQHPSLIHDSTVLRDMAMLGQEYLNYFLEKLGFLNKISYFKEKDMRISIYCAVSDVEAIINIADGALNDNVKPRAYYNQTQVDTWERPNLIELIVDKDEFQRLRDAEVFESKIVL